jgi:hypothetical protein
MEFEVFTVTNIKIMVFWDVTLCTLVGGYHSYTAAAVFRVEEVNLVDGCSRFL